MTVPTVDLEQVGALCSAIESMLTEVRGLELRAVAKPGSPAYAEWSGYEDTERLGAAYGQANLCLEVATEHLDAMAVAIRKAEYTTVPFSCFRVVLEASAVAHWLLEPGLGAVGRAGRSFAVSYQDLYAQRAFANVAKDRPWVLAQPDWQSTIDDVNRRIDELAVRADALGFEVFKDGKGKIEGLGVRWPGPTRLVRVVFGLDAELHYRIACSVVHSSPAQLLGLSFGKQESGLVKSVPAIALAGICLGGLEYFARLIWANATHLGDYVQPIEAILERAYDAADLKADRRFWCEEADA